MVDLMLDRLAMLEDVSLVALSWPRNHEPAKLKPKQAMAKKLDRMTLIASQTAFLAAISRRVEEIGQLELAHMHGPLTSGLHDCIGVWSKVRGLVVGVHASSFCINELEVRWPFPFQKESDAYICTARHLQRSRDPPHFSLYPRDPLHYLPPPLLRQYPARSA